MPFEAIKTKKILDNDDTNYFKGEGIDIGCGPCPISENALGFDIDSGDANNIKEFITDKFDYVFSSHCLEHMFDPRKSFKDWWSLVKKNGYLIIAIPDEDLYEQGYFPSLFNSDHKYTFTISKNKSWSTKSINVLSLLESISGYETIRLETQDDGYQRNILHHSNYSRNRALFLMNLTRRFSSFFKAFGIRNWLNKNLNIILRLPIDQTQSDALAQILIILKKTS